MGLLINDKDILKEFYGRTVIIFGNGNIGKRLVRLIYDDIHIKCIVDNRVLDDVEQTYMEITLCHPENLVTLRHDEPIIVASSKFADEIACQLMGYGYSPIHDFFIFNPSHEMEYESNIADFIEHNKRIWGKNRKLSMANKILIPIHPRHGCGYIFSWSYCANFLSKRYDADIYVYTRHWERIPESMLDVYRSFNAQGMVKISVTEDQRIRMWHLFLGLWKNIKNKSDLLNITIYGINFGKEIYSDFYKMVSHKMDINSEEMKDHIRKRIEEVIFWFDYIKNNPGIKAFLCVDGVYREGIIRKIAIKYGLDVYCISGMDACKAVFEQNIYADFKYYRKYFAMLSDKEKKYGIAWAKEHLQLRFKGDLTDLMLVGTSRTTYHPEKKERLTKPTSCIKVVICSHCFSDNPMWSEWQLFLDHYEWLLHLGELAKLTSKRYEWYLKIHPCSRDKDIHIINDYLKGFQEIHLLPIDTSPVQLAKEGVRFALTMWGSIGHEYPLLGIQVINAAYNPHIAYDFNWHPRSLLEYDNMLMNLETLHKDVDSEDIYEFYCMYYLFCRQYINVGYELFGNKQSFSTARADDGSANSRSYREFMNYWTETQHDRILENTRNCFEMMDSYQEGIFRKTIDRKNDSPLS